MSYAARRGRGGPQVNYHQAQNNPRTRQSAYPPVTTTFTPGYTTAGAGAQGYSTVQTGRQTPAEQQPTSGQGQPDASATPVTATGATAAATGMQPPPLPNQVPPPTSPPAPGSTAPTADNLSASQLLLTPGSVKGEPAALASGDSSDINPNQAAATGSDAETNGEGRKKPFWVKKGPGYKVSKKVRRRRQNARLRRLLTPKNALMVLHELHPGLKFTVQEQLNAINQTVYSVSVEIESKVYHGQGISKASAKQAACENALKALLLERMGKAASSPTKNEGTIEDQIERIVTENSQDDKSTDFDMMDDSMDGSSKMKHTRSFPEDDVPWGSLASFALHKLFVEWQNQGIQVPMAPPRTPPAAIATHYLSRPLSHGSNTTAVQVVPTASGSPMPMKKIPEDASKRNPVQLLNQLRPGSQYSESLEGQPPHHTFTISVNVDGKEYFGVATNKKVAKRECAKAALVDMGIVYDSSS